MYKELTLEEGNKVLIPLGAIVGLVESDDEDIIKTTVFTKDLLDELAVIHVREDYQSLKFLLLADPSKGD